MIDEKGAVAALKEAWRKGGYRFVYSNGILSVRAEGWGIQGALENVPAKVLGLIAEHFGSFPEDGDAFELKKGAAEQSVMYDQEEPGGTRCASSSTGSTRTCGRRR